MLNRINKNAAGSAMIWVFIAFIIIVTVMVLAYKYSPKYEIPHYYAYLKDEKDTSHNDYTKYLILK